MEMVHNQDTHRFEISQDGACAFVEYVLSDNALNIVHTLVPEAFRGQGLAGKLVKAAYDYAKEQKLQCLATCSYAVKWLERHPEYEGKPSANYIPDTCPLPPLQK